MYTDIKDFSEHVDKEVLFHGWVYNVRSSGKIMFLQIRDGADFAQAIVAKADVSDEVWAVAETLTIESSLELKGIVSKHPKKEEYELQVSEVTPIQISEEYPIGKKEHGPDFLLNNRHLWLRSPRQWAIQRVRNTIINAIYEHLNAEGYIKIDAPILTPTSCEDSTELFEMDYFPGDTEGENDKAYLTQSGQLYIEAAIYSHGKVFDFGPVFRAEKSKTRRHLTEFWMMDVETAFANWQDNMDIQEKLIHFVIKTVLEKNVKELEVLERDTAALEKCLQPFKRMSHAEAVVELQKLGSDIKPDEDLGGDDETTLTAQYDVPIFVDKYPAKVKAFYMPPDEEDPTRVLCSDLLAPEGYGEVIGGSQRIHDYDLMVEKMKEFGIDREPLEWYLDLRKYGSVPHSGFGVGLERLVGWMCGTKHVRETIPFPRMINRLTP